MNEMCSLVNVGVYAAKTAYAVLAINTVGAMVALTGYVLLVPQQGVFGAIEATIAGQGARLVLFFLAGRRRAPINHGWGLIVAVVSIDLVLALTIDHAPGVATRALLLTVCLVALGALGWRVAFTNRPVAFRESLA
jgi:hypothetical protein